MGNQSSRIYFRGMDHKEIYFRGNYHDKMYIGSELVWEKNKLVHFSFTPTGMYGIPVTLPHGRAAIIPTDSYEKFYLYMPEADRWVETKYNLPSGNKVLYAVYRDGILICATKKIPGGLQDYWMSIDGVNWVRSDSNVKYYGSMYQQSGFDPNFSGTDSKGSAYYNGCYIHVTARISLQYGRIWCFIWDTEKVMRTRIYTWYGSAGIDATVCEAGVFIIDNVHGYDYDGDVAVVVRRIDFPEDGFFSVTDESSLIGPVGFVRIVSVKDVVTFSLRTNDKYIKGAYKASEWIKLNSEGVLVYDTVYIPAYECFVRVAAEIVQWSRDGFTWEKMDGPWSETGLRFSRPIYVERKGIYTREEQSGQVYLLTF